MSRRVSGSGRLRFPAMLLLAATILVYVGVARSGFLNYDDGLYLTGNRVVTTGLNPTSLRWAFGSLGYAANWHPVTWVSHLVDVELFGLRPGAHHLVSLAIHLVNIVLLLLLLWRLTGSRWMAVAVAAFFALHPQNVQSVAWLAERKNVLSTMLMLAAFLAWLGHLERPAGRRVTLWSTALLLFGLSLMAKPMPVTLPVLLLLADWWPLGRHRGGVGPGRLLAEKVPFFILSAASAAVTLVAQGRGEAIMGVGDYPVGWRIATAVVGAATYLRRLVWPDDLAVFHPMPHGWPAQTVLAAALLLGALALLAWRSRRRFPAGLAGLGWYLVALLPVIGLVQVGEQSTADRYAYLPTIGIFVAVAALWRRWAERGIVARPLAAAVFLAALTLMGARTAREVTYWRDSTTLFRRALEKTRENWLAHGNLGAALFEKGDRAQALLHQREVVRLRPGFARGRAALARTLAAEGALVEAAAEYQQAIRLEPGLVDAAVGLAQVMEEMGLEQETDNYFRWMIDSRVGDERVLFAWADFLLRRGRTREAADRYRRGLEANPLNAVVRNTYATALARLGMTGEAETEFRRAVGLNAGLIEPRRNLALLLEQTGRPAEALRLYREVLRLEPMDRVAAEGVERLTGGDGRP